MDGTGKKLNEIGYKTTTLDEQGFSLDAIKRWREAQVALGQPSSLEDFFRLHGICLICKCYGLQMTGWDEQDGAPLWTVCATCGGTGRVPPAIRSR